MAGDPGAVGLIGLGEIGQVHAVAIQRSRTARLVAVAEVAPELRVPFEAQGVRGYHEAAELIAGAGVGTVSVCLPHHLHFPVAMAAIRAGQSVLVEKPLTVSLDEGRRLVDAAAAAGVALGVSHNQVFYTAHVEAKRLIEGGAIGRPVLIRLRLGMGPTWGGWRGSPGLAGGGLLADAGVHRLYLAPYFFGPVREVRAVLDAPRQQGETFAVVVLVFGYRPGPALSMFRDREWQEVPTAPDDWAASVQASVIAYLDAVTAGREPPATGAAALETISLLERIYDTAAVLPGPRMNLG